MSEQRQSVKRRRYYTTKNNSRMTFQRGAETVTTSLFPETTIPTTILYSQTPQDLLYAILSTEKAYFTKQELLTILSKLDKMYQPQFDGECSYIV